MSVGRGFGAFATLIAFLMALGFLSIVAYSPTSPPGIRAAESGIPHEPYTAARLETLRRENRPVFINATAAWCITCLVNERVALSTDEVRTAFEKQGVTYLKGDWTRQDPRITELLKQHDRSGVPLYLFYPAGTGSGAQVLPQLLTPGIVTTALRGGAT